MNEAPPPITRASIWMLLQLADGTFPSGGFAHSLGLEASTVLGGLSTYPDSVGEFLDTSLRHAASAVLPFVRASHAEPSRLEALDLRFDATVSFRGLNAASRAQGRALLGAIARVFESCEPLLTEVTAAKLPCHHGPVFGVIFSRLGVSSTETTAAYLHGVARAILSAAVRLGLFGPLEAQRLLASRAPLMSELESTPSDLHIAAGRAPIIELYAALHERLDGRMFQS